MDWTRNRLDEIQIYHKELSEKRDSNPVDDITWNDLEMDDVFLHINQTKSFIGEQVLYHRLHEVGTEWDWNFFEEQMTYLSENEDTRIKIEKKMSAIGKREEDYHLPTFLMHTELWKIGNSIWLHVLQVLLAVFLAGSIFGEQKIWGAGLVGIAVVNLMVYLKVKQQYEVYLFSVGSLRDIIKFGKWMLDNEKCRKLMTVELDSVIGELHALSKKMMGWQSRKYASMTGDIAAMLQDYLLGITVVDVAAFNHIMKLIHSKQDKVLLLYEFVGQMDMLLSVAAYRNRLEVWCEPEIGNADGIV